MFWGVCGKAWGWREGTADAKVDNNWQYGNDDGNGDGDGDGDNDGDGNGNCTMGNGATGYDDNNDGDRR